MYRTALRAYLGTRHPLDYENILDDARSADPLLRASALPDEPCADAITSTCGLRDDGQPERT